MVDRNYTCAMRAVNRSSFVHVTVIRTTPDKLWEALTDAKLICRYWFEAIVECSWKKGSSFIAALSEGWPLVLSNLKSLLETGEVAIRHL